MRVEGLLTNFLGFLVMFDLILGLQQAVEGEAQVEADIVVSQPFFREILGFGLM